MFPSLVLWVITWAFSIWSTLSLLFNFVQPNHALQAVSQLAPLPSIPPFSLSCSLSDSFQLLHLASFIEGLSKAACVIMTSPPTPFPSTPTLLFPSSIHPSLWWRGGMQGCIPGLMKLILQESRPKWSLNQHHKNKRLLVQVVSHTRLLRHFNVFLQRKRKGTQGNRKFRTLFSSWSGLHHSIMQTGRTEIYIFFF